MKDYSKLSIEERKAMNASARKKLAEGAIKGVKKLGEGVLKGVSLGHLPLKAGAFIGNALRNRFGKPLPKPKMKMEKIMKYKEK